MKVAYRKPANVKLVAIDGEAFLLHTDVPHAFALNESGTVLWEALDHYEDPDALAALVGDAHGELQPQEASDIVRTFLTALVENRLLDVCTTGRLRKNADLTTEPVGDELMVLSRSDRKVHLMNDCAALLWTALDHFGTRTELEDILAEAWPTRTRADIGRLVGNFLARLVGLGLIVEEA